MKILRLDDFLTTFLRPTTFDANACNDANDDFRHFSDFRQLFAVIFILAAHVQNRIFASSGCSCANDDS